MIKTLFNGNIRFASLSFFHLALHVSLLVLPWRGLELSLITKRYNFASHHFFSGLGIQNNLEGMCEDYRSYPILVPFFHQALGRCQRAHVIRVSLEQRFAKNKPVRKQGECDRDPQITHTGITWFFLLAKSTTASRSFSFFSFSFLKEIKCKRYVSTALKLSFRHVFQCYDSPSNCNSTSLHILLQGIKINITLYTAEYITTALRNTVAIWEQH